MGLSVSDSDYDCRFVYLRPPEQHYVLRVQRDVIEFPIEGEIDTGGWDLRKALLLALKGNAVVAEWASSPFVYEEVEGFRHRFRVLLAEILPVGLAVRHYAGLLREHVSRDLTNTKLKRLLYALRPALALHYMEERDFREFPPMNIDDVLGNVRIDDDLRNEIDVLIAAKKATRELGTGPVPNAIGRFIAAADERYRTIPATFAEKARETQAGRYRLAEEFYREMVLDRMRPPE